MNQLPMNPAARGRASAETFAMPFFAGEVIAGKYEVVELIGAGAVGYVVAARRIDLGDTIAIKILRPELRAYDEVVWRFMQEARTAVMIQSQHVVRIFDVGFLQQVGPFIAMEFLDGKDLSGVIAERGPLPAATAAEYVLQACEALATAHACGVIHRDVKPENLFLTRSLQGMDVIKVLDFGISKVLAETADHRAQHALTMTSVGSPMYMSPEQVRASKDLDVRSDIWGLGCVLYELLTGNPAFDALSVTELVSKILERDPAPVRSLRADVAPELESIVFRCLHKYRDLRFANVAELAVELFPFASERGRVWAQRCCHVLGLPGPLTTEALPAAAPTATWAAPQVEVSEKSDAMEKSPTSVSPSVSDLEAAGSSDLVADSIGLSATRARELGRSGQGRRRAAVVLGSIVVAGVCVLCGVRPASSNGGRQDGPFVLVSDLTAPPPPPPVTALPVLSSSGSTPIPSASAAKRVPAVKKEVKKRAPPVPDDDARAELAE